MTRTITASYHNGNERSTRTMTETEFRNWAQGEKDALRTPGRAKTINAVLSHVLEGTPCHPIYPVGTCAHYGWLTIHAEEAKVSA